MIIRKSPEELDKMRKAGRIVAGTIEVVVAANAENDQHLAAESADLLYHLLVLLEARGVTLADVEAALEKRTAQSGHEEKSARSR